MTREPHDNSGDPETDQELMSSECELILDELPLYCGDDALGGGSAERDATGSDADGGEGLTSRIETHLASCPTCSAELASYRQHRAALMKLRLDTTAECPIDLWPAIAQTIAETSPSAAAPRETTATLQPSGSIRALRNLTPHELAPAAETAVTRPAASTGRPVRGNFLTMGLAAAVLVLLGVGFFQRLTQEDRPPANSLAHSEGDRAAPGLPLLSGHAGTGPDQRQRAATAASLPLANPFGFGLMTPADIYGGARLLLPAGGKAGGAPGPASSGEPASGELYLQQEFQPVAPSSKLRF